MRGLTTVTDGKDGCGESSQFVRFSRNSCPRRNMAEL